MKRLIGTFDAQAPAGAALDDPVRRALEEDHAFDDRSTRPLPGADRPASARVIARESGVLAGVRAFTRAFELVADGPVRVEGRTDGDVFRSSDTVLRIEAPGRVLLAGERTGLNFLQRLSGIATVTRRCVDAVGGRIAVCDTRKTTPGLRALEKWAVVVGGGRSHRWSLGDMVMLKENHLALAGGITPAVEAVRADQASGRLPLTVEVRTFDEAREAAALRVDRILLDNLAPAEMRRIADALGKDRPELEASGGLGPEALADVAGSGVDLVSLGSLTHSVKSIDLSFLIEGA